MSKIEGNYVGTHYDDVVSRKKKKTEEPASKKTGAAAETGQSGQVKQAKLSDAAQKLLEKLKKQYGNMDFMVADYESGSEAKKILSRGTKEFSVLFSTEELEKMASDEKYEQEYMDKVQGAVNMSNKISEQFGFGKASENGELTSVGISFNSDGTTTIFAELEKASKQQQERIDAIREKRAEEKKESSAKRITVQASTQDELLKKLETIDWRKVKEEKKTPGDKFDFTA